ncbi:MAG TPA: FadR/GntR family transcriptional regulator [Woeseiaceae bacterium]|nr:FadR/GntR family transcriptional regulator [Woeseiaceae bacterium]
MKKASSLAGIAPALKREALAEQIVRRIVGRIRSGNLRPGDRLPAERTLASQLGVGRPTLREALRALQLLGILDIRHGGGVFVSNLQPEALFGPLQLFVDDEEQNLTSLLEARKVIEGAVLAFVATKISDKSIAKLNDNLGQLEALIQQSSDNEVYRQRFQDLAQEFRHIVEVAADNPVLARTVQNFDVFTTAARNHLVSIESPRHLLANHRRIVEALSKRDPEAAKKALEAHIDYLCGISRQIDAETRSA